MTVHSLNAFNVLGISGAESPISALLSALLQSREVPSDALLSALRGNPVVASVVELRASTEVRFKGLHANRRADLVIDWIDSARNSHQLILEVKLFAHEGEDQTHDYVFARESWRERHREQVDAFSVTVVEQTETQFAFLTLFGEAAESPSFKAIRFASLIGALRAYRGLRDARGILASDLAEQLEEAEECSQLTLERPLSDLFANARTATLDAQFGVFVRFVNAAAELGGFLPPTTYRGNGVGRRWFGAHLARPHWSHPHSRTRRPTDFVPLRDFYVHFQPRIHINRNGEATRMDIGAYDELLPYFPERGFEKHVQDGDLRDAFRAARRQRVALMFESLPALNWRRSGHRNQFAAWVHEVDLNEESGKLAGMVATELKKAADAIEVALVGRWPSAN